MRLTFLLVLAICFFSACQDQGSSTTTTTTTTTEPAPKMKYTLTPFTPSPEFNDAKMEKVDYKNGKFTYTLAEGTSYELGAQTSDAPQKNCANSGKGQHIHAIVDDKPYAARYTAEFDDLKLEDGDHKMLSFLSRSYHESIKTNDAHQALNLKIVNNSIAEATPISEPMVWYSRPKGTYKGKANTAKVMLDFYLVNTNLDNGNVVKADINGETHTIAKWQPYYIEGLPMGKNKITLSLLDKNGKLIKTSQNPISREFNLETDPTE